MSLQEACDTFGIRVPRSKQIMCPTGHDKASPSMHLYFETDSYTCFGCGATGDVYGFIAMVSGKSIGRVLREYSDGFGPAVSTRGKNPQMVREHIIRMLVLGTQPAFDAIRRSDLEYWQKDLLIDEFDRLFEDWMSGYESEAPFKLERAIRDELPSGIRRWMRERKIGDGNLRREAEDRSRRAVMEMALPPMQGEGPRATARPGSTLLEPTPPQGEEEPDDD
jgi:hypothetical protein